MLWFLWLNSWQFFIFLTCYLKIKVKLHLKELSLALVASLSTAIPTYYTCGLKYFPTFLACFCSPILSKTSFPKANLNSMLCFYASTCTDKCFRNNIIVHFYYNLGSNHGSFSQSGILKRTCTNKSSRRNSTFEM